MLVFNNLLYVIPFVLSIFQWTHFHNNIFNITTFIGFKTQKVLVTAISTALEHRRNTERPSSSCDENIIIARPNKSSSFQNVIINFIYHVTG